MRVAIAGAGKVGRAIARELLTNGHQILLIDWDPELVRPGVVQGAETLLADACELSSLETADISQFDVVVAATGDDKVNLVVSLLAKTEFGVPRIVARVNHPKNEWLFNESWGVDVAVSTPRMLSALVEEAVAVGDLVRLFEFQQGSAELVEMTLASNSPVLGLSLEEITWPPDTVPVAVVRGTRVFAPNAVPRLAPGDEVLVVAAPSQERHLQSLMSGASSPE